MWWRFFAKNTQVNDTYGQLRSYEVYYCYLASSLTAKKMPSCAKQHCMDQKDDQKFAEPVSWLGVYSLDITCEENPDFGKLTIYVQE